MKLTKKDFEAMPKNFARCFKSDCPCAAECLRAQAVTLAKTKQTSYPAINVNVAKGGKDCQFYMSPKPIRVAWGMKDIYKIVPLGIERRLRTALKVQFGYYRYYRMRRGDEPIYPEEQNVIAEWFKEYGIENLPEFDNYTEELRWLKPL